MGGPLRHIPNLDILGSPPRFRWMNLHMTPRTYPIGIATHLIRYHFDLIYFLQSSNQRLGTPPVLGGLLCPNWN